MAKEEMVNARNEKSEWKERKGNELRGEKRENKGKKSRTTVQGECQGEGGARPFYIRRETDEMDMIVSRVGTSQSKQEKKKKEADPSSESRA